MITKTTVEYFDCTKSLCLKPVDPMRKRNNNSNKQSKNVS